MIGRLLLRLRADCGFSVAELTVASALMAIVIGVTGTALTNDLMRVTELDHESRNIDELRTAMARLERDIRSAECIGQPDATVTNPAQGMTLAMRTKAGGTLREIVWSVPPGGGDLTRSENGGSPVVVVAAMDGATLFTHDAPDRLVVNEPNRSQVTVRLVRQGEGGLRSDRTLKTLVTARNATVAAPAGTCP